MADPQSKVVGASAGANSAVKAAYRKLFGYDVTRYSFVFMAKALVYGLIWYTSLVKWLALSWLSKERWDTERHFMDRSSLQWARRTLSSTGNMPVITGLENLPKEHGGTKEDDGMPLMIVANHASWMDVPVIRQITRKCKFLAKKDLGKVPILGHSLRWGHHPLVDRSDKRSTVKSFRQGVEWLKKGVSLVTFPEGTRSLDGRLASVEDMKGGAFKMAIYSGARVVPVSISGTFDIMPKTALFPLKRADGHIRVTIHPGIDTTKDMKEDELAAMTHKLIASGLPASQQPLALENEQQ
eukprot:CAMPEP_0197526820 /NCGR_PEP_ID=MMETSP1318-20131121/19503_1 /TAXON_ID=552666 /ORGANISM="Partenskyella glossopodia, Strain RCC365" /LENGTH=296 /DNA_ID=CAMNT_0043081177 /DNA_START=261 /DNA_END=1151 /DNA_ORIENTATION=+